MAYSTITKPSLHFNTNLYTGNDADNRGITGIGFQPDWVWIKKRSNAAGGAIFDAVRGAGKVIYPSETNAEGTETASFVSFDSDGYTISQDSGVGLNVNSHTYVGWNWKANGQGSANTDGSINTTYTSVNTTAGFSISKYVGTGANATVGHGLGSLCKWIIIKRLDGTNNWEIGSTAMGFNKHIYFTTTAEMTNSNRFQDTAPTNSVFSIGDSAGVNASGGNYIAYCFAEKKGYSKFGSYTGNGNVDGPFVYTGFKPAFVMIKETSDTGNWCMSDNKRDGYNPTKNIYADSNGNENTANTVDHYSNGFKIRSTGGSVNTSGSNMIYMAFAEEPLVANVGQGIPATAR